MRARTTLNAQEAENARLREALERISKLRGTTSSAIAKTALNP
ncbi:MAG TPA: hypothetical protein VEC57_00310 [Candidatus Limnocylindrales bacterium]|nr:hypothetical protein [Candidatus Limnocylindrales bacterium]